LKTRNSFVSNSSSSSFIVIGRGKHSYPAVDNDTFTIGVGGETEFGWNRDTISDVWSRINFAWLQANYLTTSEEMAMLFSVLREHLDVKHIESVIVRSYRQADSDSELVWGYIDHQSNATEGENLEMFNSEKDLADFLFARGSRIELNNDNW